MASKRMFKASGRVKVTRPEPIEPKRSDFLHRVLVAIPLVAITIFLIVTGGELFALGAVAIGGLAIHEFYRMVDELTPIRLVGFLSLIGFAIAALYGGPYEVLLVLMALIPVLFIFLMLGPKREYATTSLAVTLLGVCWIALPLAHAVMLRGLPHGGGVITAVLVGTFIGDTAAYLGGKSFGRHKLAPAISPNKTVEGLVSGVIGAVLGVMFTGLYQDWINNVDALLLGLGVAVIAPLGDLFESLVKRDVGVKDSGTAFGPHGGALDRIDAALFAIVAGFYIWVALL